MTAQKQPRILIVGGLSNLGVKLATLLLSQNCQVTIANENLELAPKDVLELGKDKNFQLKKVDILNQEEILKLGNFTHIYHLAGIEEYLKDNKLTYRDLKINSQGTENLLVLTKETGAKFILASTLDVYSGVISQTSLANYFGSVKVDFSHYSHHEAKRFAESLTAVYFENFGIKALIARIAQVYGPGMDLTSYEPLAKLIKQAVAENYLLIEGDGLEVLHPTYVDDVIWGLVKVGFSKDTVGGIYNLVASAEITVLEFAQRLKEVFSEIGVGKTLEIKFDNISSPIKFPIPKVELEKTQHDLGWKPRVELQEGLKSTLEFFLKKEEREQISPTPVSPKTHTIEKPDTTIALPKAVIPTFSLPTLKLAKTNLVITILVLILFLLAIFPVGQIVYGLAFGFKNFSESREALLLGDFSKAQKEATQAVQAARVAFLGFQKFEPIFLVLQRENWFFKVKQDFEGIQIGLLGFENLTGVLAGASNLAKNIILSQENSLSSDFSQVQLNFGKAISDFETASLYLTDSKLGKIPFFGQNFTNLQEQLHQNLPHFKKAERFLGLLPEFLAFEGEKTYLVLFENNSELRPGGGFIGSYGLLEFKNGKMAKMQIDDVYNLDGAQKVKIEPPAPLKQHLGVQNLGLRDSGWHFDFSINGATAANLYSQITGKTVDGVIAVDVTTFENLLKITGPLKLSDYEEEITADNLAEKAEYYSEIGFFPGSTAKKDFLGSFARNLILRLQEGEQLNYLGIVKTLAASADEKHLMFYLQNPNLASFVTDIGWSGQIAQIATSNLGQTEISTDFILFSEANVGANKSNRFVKRTIKLATVILRDGDLITTFQIEYQNTSPAPTWPGGNYKNYLRIITPVGSKLEQFKISEQDVTGAVEQVVDADKQIFAVFFEVPAGEKRSITLIYRPSYRIRIEGESATYNLLVQKQPGMVGDSFEIDLSYPGYLRFIKANKMVTTSEQRVNFSENLKRDLNFRVEFSL